MRTRMSMGFLFLFVSLCNAQNEIEKGGVLYSQNVIRDDKMFADIFKYKRGVLSLTTDSLVFKSKKMAMSKFDFSISYDQIISIRPFYGFILPNRIRIRTKIGESYRLFTYKKRDIIRVTRREMARLK